MPISRYFKQYIVTSHYHVFPVVAFLRGFFGMSLKRELVFKLSKGYVGRGNNVFSVAKPRVTKALQKAYKDRKRKKRDQRSIWIMQINAGEEKWKKKKKKKFEPLQKGARLYGMTYSSLIAGLSKANVVLDRKVLSELAMFEPFSFRAVTLAAESSGFTPTRIGDSRTIISKKVANEKS
jgi:large subunit ribosomal protein L20